jgi:hypothetical protein
VDGVSRDQWHSCAIQISMMIRAALLAITLASLPATAGDGEKERGVAGKVMIAAELLAATSWPVDDDRATSIRTPARLRLPVGRPLLPLTEPMPEVLFMLEGEGLPKDARPPPTIKLRGMRFEPGQFTLPRPGFVAFQNDHNVVLTLVDQDGKELGVLAANQTTQIELVDGMQRLSTKEMPSATATANVRRHGRVMTVRPNGEIDKVDVPGGEYVIAVYLGAKSLRADQVVVPDQGVLFFSYTVSANGVVDVTPANQAANRPPIDDAAPGTAPSIP